MTYEKPRSVDIVQTDYDSMQDVLTHTDEPFLLGQSISVRTVYGLPNIASLAKTFLTHANRGADKGAGSPTEQKGDTPAHTDPR